MSNGTAQDVRMVPVPHCFVPLRFVLPACHRFNVVGKKSRFCLRRPGTSIVHNVPLPRGQVLRFRDTVPPPLCQNLVNCADPTKKVTKSLSELRGSSDRTPSSDSAESVIPQNDSDPSGMPLLQSESRPTKPDHGNAGQPVLLPAEDLPYHAASEDSPRLSADQNSSNSTTVKSDAHGHRKVSDVRKASSRPSAVERANRIMQSLLHTPSQNRDDSRIASLGEERVTQPEEQSQLPVGTSSADGMKNSRESESENHEVVDSRDVDTSSESATAHSNDALKPTPAETSELLRLEGRKCEKECDMSLAVELYRRCILLDISNGKGWQDLAKASGRLDGGYRRSSDILREGLEANPSNPYLWQSLGFSEFRLSRYESARKCFVTGLKCDPNHSPIYSTWGRMEGMLGNAARSRELFEEGAKADPSDVRLYFSWATMERKLGNKARARELFQTGLEYDPQNSYIWQSLGTMAADIGEADQARTCFQNALSSDENSIAVLDHWGRLESRLGNWQTAADLFAKGMRGNPADARILHSWSQMELQRKNFETAKHLIQRAVALSSKDSILWTQFGKIEAASGNLPRARALLKRAVDINPRDW